MRTLVALLTICLVTVQVQAKEPTKTAYRQLLMEQLAMRFRFPDRYMDITRGEPAPKDMAFYEMVRRGLIRVGTTKTDVEFLLGSSEYATENGTNYLNFGMMGGGLAIVLDKNGTVLSALVHHDGDPDSAHVEPVKLQQKDTEQGGAAQPATAPESKAQGKEKPKPESEGRPK